MKAGGGGREDSPGSAVSHHRAEHGAHRKHAHLAILGVTLALDQLSIACGQREGRTTGERLRIDTTAFETNIHYPTDSSLLWDTYRVMTREIERLRKCAPSVVGNRRLQTKQVKRLALRISRAANRKVRDPQKMKSLYKSLLKHAEAVLGWADELATRLIGKGTGAAVRGFEHIATTLETYRGLGLRVVDQARRRVLQGESVPNDEKLFSLFEEHTELLKRGKAGKEIEFGHMISIEQVDGKFITGYDVFRKRPEDSSLVIPALDRHRALFGHDPDLLAADKPYYGDASSLEAVRERIGVVSIAKTGGRTDEETARERSLAFKLGQQFRAGVEGTISFLKRALGMWRCLNKGWDTIARPSARPSSRTTSWFWRGTTVERCSHMALRNPVEPANPARSGTGPPPATANDEIVYESANTRSPQRLLIPVDASRGLAVDSKTPSRNRN